ncbi:MAG: RidA family protein [Clostridia bacterium]|nr:RidA family protein [Clostridia bacterium]
MEYVNTDKAPAAIGPYSQAVKCGGMVYTSGQIAIEPSTGNIVEGGIKEQTHKVCQNVAALLQAAGTDMSKVVKTVCFIADMGDFAAFNEVYAQYFISKPARSCVAVKTLPKNVLVEIDTITAL